MTKEIGAYEQIGRELGRLVDEKNRAYGDSFRHAPEILRHLWPEGIRPEQYRDLLAVVRIVDKMKRIATDRDAFGENPWRDIGGYALLMLLDVVKEGDA